MASWGSEKSGTTLTDTFIIMCAAACCSLRACCLLSRPTGSSKLKEVFSFSSFYHCYILVMDTDTHTNYATRVNSDYILMAW